MNRGNDHGWYEGFAAPRARAACAALAAVVALALAAGVAPAAAGDTPLSIRAVEAAATPSCLPAVSTVKSNTKLGLYLIIPKGAQAKVEPAKQALALAAPGVLPATLYFDPSTPTSGSDPALPGEKILGSDEIAARISSLVESQATDAQSDLFVFIGSQPVTPDVPTDCFLPLVVDNSAAAKKSVTEIGARKDALDKLVEDAVAAEPTDPASLSVTIPDQLSIGANGNASLTIELRSNASLVSFDVTNLLVSVADANMLVKTPDKPLTVEPGKTETVTVPVTINSDFPATTNAKVSVTFDRLVATPGSDGSKTTTTSVSAATNNKSSTSVTTVTTSTTEPPVTVAMKKVQTVAVTYTRRVDTSTNVGPAGDPTTGSTPWALLSGLGLLAVAVAAGGGFLFGRTRLSTAGDGLDGAPPMPGRAEAPAPRPPVPPPVRPMYEGRSSWARFAGTEPAVQIVEQDDAMRIRAEKVDAGAAWSVDAPSLLAVGMWTEKVAGKGEDAEPTLLFDVKRRVGIIATYDGSGGAGSAPAMRRPDGTELSGAYVASRLARETTEAWFRNGFDPIAEPGELAKQLHDELAYQFATEWEACLESNSRIAGSLRRDLPTTLSAATFSVDPNGGLRAVSLWAGDSRTHLLTADDGLQQLTRDDAPNSDALELLINDAPMTNLVCVDRPFTINADVVAAQTPSVLVTATDGCFGYVVTPAHYELLLLRCLGRAANPAEWARLLAEEFAGFTSDDASLALVAVGYDSFADLQQSFADREQALEEEHWAPFEGLSADDFEPFANARRESWERYKATYERMLFVAERAHEEG